MLIIAGTPHVVPTKREEARFEGQGPLIVLPCWGWLPLQEGCVMDDAEALGLTGNNSLPRGTRALTGLRQPGRNNSSHSTAPQQPRNPPLQVHLPAIGYPVAMGYNNQHEIWGAIIVQSELPRVTNWKWSIVSHSRSRTGTRWFSPHTNVENELTCICSILEFQSIIKMAMNN